MATLQAAMQQNNGIGIRGRRRRKGRRRGPGLPEMPEGVIPVNANTYRVQAGTETITVMQAKVILRRSGRLRRWAWYLIGRIADTVTAIEVFLGSATADEVREWLLSLPWTAAAREAAYTLLEKALGVVKPERLFIALGIMVQRLRPAQVI